MPDARWSTELAIKDGPQLRGTRVLNLEAYDRITVVVPGADGGPSAVTVEMQPGGAGQVRLIAVAASSYEPPVTYAVDGNPDPPAVLDAPLQLFGAGAVALLGATQNQMKLTNEDSTEVIVDIVVGRDAIA